MPFKFNVYVISPLLAHSSYFDIPKSDDLKQQQTTSELDSFRFVCACEFSWLTKTTKGKTFSLFMPLVCISQTLTQTRTSTHTHTVTVVKFRHELRTKTMVQILCKWVSCRSHTHTRANLHMCELHTSKKSWLCVGTTTGWMMPSAKTSSFPPFGDRPLTPVIPHRLFSF